MTDASQKRALAQGSSSGIRDRLLKGMGANFLGQVLNVMSKVLLVPLFLQAWGAEVYGEWLLLTSFVFYLSLTDMGGQLYIVNRLTQAYAQGDIQLFRKALHTGLALFLVMPTVIFAIFLAVVSLIPLEAILQISETTPQVVMWVLAILAFQFVFALPLGILLGTYRAVGLLPRGVMLSNLAQFLRLVFMAGGLLLGAGMVEVSILYVVPHLFVAILAARGLNNRFPQFELLSLKRADLSTGLTFVKPSLHFLSIQLSEVFSVQGMVLIVGMVLAPVQVVIFSTLRIMVYVARQLLYLVTHAAWPEMTRLDAEQNFEKLHILFRAILRSILTATVVFTTILYFFGDDIYRLWVGDAVAYQESVMNLFLIYILQLVFWTTCSNLLMAINVHHTLSKILLVSSVLSIALAYLGGQYFALEGVVAGMIVGDLLLPFWFVPYLLNKYEAGFSIRFYLKEAVPVIGVLVGVVLFPLSTPFVLLLLLIWWLGSISSMNALESQPQDRISKD